MPAEVKETATTASSSDEKICEILCNRDICYYSTPKKKRPLQSLQDTDPELLRYFDKLGVPLNEQKRLANVAVDTVLNSVSMATTYRKTLEKAEVIFCSISDAIKEYLKLVHKYLGKVVPSDDNYYADGSFFYISKDTKCPMQISPTSESTRWKRGSVKKALKLAVDEKDSILASIPAELKIKGSLVHASLIEGKGGLQTLFQSIKEQDANKVSMNLASTLDIVAELELLQAPGLSFLLPEQYAQQYPRSIP
ncbi:hypothetical protein VIGAN_04127300 [Vigna angularis var. angularis]|uniref:Uncharacterized protein n=1 Tax=Vigna angularis var. angularis TaxID=157739 RepID=A0A0S3RTS3_PHAAN|nr:UPF0051 protein ABCI8, chloroplastic-like [Vigna angularis]BAT84011.1 hypothetical protein VIGAN_04127300 [Vigna angularis var. angularis]